MYDTSKDLDGGSWRMDDKAKATSWYNETIDNTRTACVVDTDDRCGAREFPATAILVATTTKLYIYDAKDNTLWMDFRKGSGATEQMIGPTTNSTGATVWASNGRIYFGSSGTTGGLYAIDMKTDRATRYNTTDDYVGTNTVANRNSTQTWVTGPLTGPSGTIADNAVNSVMAQTDRLGEVVVAVGTDAGASVINETSRTIFSYSDVTGDDYNSVYINRYGDLIALNETQQQAEQWSSVISDIASELNGTPEKFWDQTTDPPLFPRATAQTINIAPKAIAVSDGTSQADDRSDTLYFAHGGGITRIQHHRSSTTNGLAKFYTKDYISEENIGNARAVFPMNESSGGTAAIIDVSNNANVVTSQGTPTFSVSGVRGTAITFNQASSDYLCSETGTGNGSCDDDGDYDTTTSDIAVGAWVKRSASGTDIDVIASKWGNAIADQSFRLYFDASDFPTFETTDGISVTLTSVSPTAITDTNWHHIMGVFDNGSNTQYLYVDGMRVDSDSATHATPNSTVAFTIGADLSGAANAAANFFRGTIDEAFVAHEDPSTDTARRLFETGWRALSNHTANRITGVTGADTYQQLLGNATGGISTTNNAVSVAFDEQNRFIYAGLNDGVGNTGGVTIIADDSDTALDLFDGTANTGKDDDIGTQFSANDVVAISLAGSPCIGYNGGSTTCNNTSTLAIAGTNDTATRVWMERGVMSIDDALSVLGSSTLTKANTNVTNIFQIYNAYNRDDEATTGEQYATPALRIDSSGMVTYNYLNPQTSGTAWSITDAIHTSGTVMDVTASSLTTGNLFDLTANALTTGTLLDTTANTLTSGQILNLKSSATAFTGDLELISLTGSNANNTGNLLRLENTGTLNANKSLYIQHYATGTNNLAMRVDDESGDTTPFVIDGAGNVGINESAPYFDLQIGAESGSTPIFAMSDPEVSHGVTGGDANLADMFFSITSISSTAGGAQLSGVSDTDATGLNIQGIIGSNTPTNSVPAIKIYGSKFDGSNAAGDLDVDSTQGGTNAETVFQLANNNDTPSFTMLGNGNIGIGNQVTPLAKLHIVSNPIAANYTTGRAALIVDQFENQDVLAASASGTTVARLDRSGYMYAERFVDIGNSNGTYYLDAAATGATNSLSVAGDIISGASGATTNTFTIKSTSNRNIIIDAGTGDIILGTADGTGAEVCVSIDGSTCGGKIDVATVDPPYTIEGKNYATYMATMTGVKEETTGKVQTMEYVPGIGYRAVIDFANSEEGSDIWLFGRASDLSRHIDDMVVLLSPSGNARAWHIVDRESMRLAIYTSKPTTVSYRLTAPRFDSDVWGNRRSDEDRLGLQINNEGRITVSGEGNLVVDEFSGVTIEPVEGWENSYVLRDGSGDILEDSAAFARLLVANIRSGFIQGVNGLFGRIVITEQITAPVAEIDTVRTDYLSPLATDSGRLSVTLNDTQTFGVTNAETEEPVATFDNLGNATLSGTLTADSVQTNEASVAGTLTTDSLVTNDASVSGELYADRIVSSFGDLNTRFLSLENSLSSFSTLSGVLPPSPAPVASASASPSGNLADAVMTQNGDLYVNTDLFVLGDTILSSTAITGTLVIDNMIRLAENVIETVTETLYIQKNKLASVDILDGTFIIDIYNRIFARGNLAVSGNTTVGGILGATSLSPIDGNNLTINLGQTIPNPFNGEFATPSAGFGDLVIKGINDTTIATITASGSATFAGSLRASELIASGSATVSKLNISTSPTPSANESAAPTNSIGSSILPAQFTEATILSSQVAADSLIYLTPLSSTGNQVLFVKEKLPGVGFVVAIDTPITTPVNFNWWIIN